MEAIGDAMLRFRQSVIMIRRRNIYRSVVTEPYFFLGLGQSLCILISYSFNILLLKENM